MKQKEIKDTTKCLSHLFEVLNQKENKIIAIAGLSKNAGKTSFLNFILKNIQEPHIAITTTGHDGEDFDLLTGLKKPKVFIPPNTLFSTNQEVISKISPFVDIIEKTKYRVIGFPLFILQSKTELETEIIGPSSVEQQMNLANDFIRLGATKVLIDGSLDRKSIVLSPEINSLVIVASPVFGTMKELINELTYIYEKTSIEVNHDYQEYSDVVLYKLNNREVKTGIHSLINHEKELIEILNIKPESIFIPSSLTDKVYQKLKNSFFSFKGKVVFRNSFQIMIKYEDFKVLKSRTHLYSIVKIPLTTFVINSYSANNNHLDSEILRRTLREYFSNIDLLDIQEPFF